MYSTVRVAIAASIFFATLQSSADLPQVTVISPTEALHAGKPAAVVYRVEWTGAPDAWRIPAPSIEQPDWGQVQIQAATTYQQGEKTVAEFEIGFIADQTGQHEIPALEFEVYAAENLVANETAPLKEPPTAWTTDQAVTSDPVVLSVVRDDRPLAIVGGVILALVLLAVGVWLTTRRRLPQASSVAPDADPREFVHEARKHRLDGDFYGFFLALGSAAGKAKGPEAVKLAARHKERAREVGYGGIRPTDDEMDAAIKDTERLLTATGG